MYIYVIKTITNKYYIGSTYYLHNEFKMIFKKNNNKSKWFNYNKPMYVHKVLKTHNETDEHLLLLEYIKTYSLENVYGDTYDSDLEYISIVNNTKI